MLNKFTEKNLRGQALKLGGSVKMRPVMFPEAIFNWLFALKVVLLSGRKGD